MSTTKPQAAALQTAPVEAAHATGGRGARERIMKAAGQLFYERGIHATGVAAFVEAAHVSTRTFYKQFDSKNALVEEYVRQYQAPGNLPSVEQLDRVDLPPAERILAVFDSLDGMLSGPDVVRGCPFHNAAVEAAGEMPDVFRVVEQQKHHVIERFADVAAEAGVEDASALGRQLGVLYEGAMALAASTNDLHVIADARAAAATLIKSALERRGQDVP